MGERIGRPSSIPKQPRANGAPDFLDETLAFWQPRTTRKLTREDAREINENLTGFFRVLMEWSRIDRDAAKPSNSGDAKISSSHEE
jgi:hypothetical protein